MTTVGNCDIIISGQSYDVNQVSGTVPGLLRPAMIDSVLKDHKNFILDHAYITEKVDEGQTIFWSTKLQDLARIFTRNVGAYAVNPSQMLDDSIRFQLSEHDRDTALGLTEQLYTPRGVQGTACFEGIKNYGIDFDDYK